MTNEHMGKKSESNGYKQILDNGNKIELDVKNLSKAVDNAGISTFMYFPKTKSITIPDNVCVKYDCRPYYNHMPDSFAKDYVYLKDRDIFCKMYERIDNGEDTSMAEFWSIQKEVRHRVTLTTISRDENNQPVNVIGIIEDIPDAENNYGREFHEINFTKVIMPLKKVYYSIHYVDITADRFWDFGAAEQIREAIGSDASYKAATTIFAKKCVVKEDQQEVIDFLNPVTIANRMKNAEVINCEYRIVNVGWCLLSAVATERDANNCVTSVLMLTSIIELEKRRELKYAENLEKALKQANEAQKAKTEFLSRMSHDIRTPMNAIIGLNTLAEQSLEDKQKVAEYLRKLDTASHTLLKLMNEVLDMSRIEAGKIKVNEESFDIDRLRRDVLVSVEAQAQKRHQTVTFDLINVKHNRIYADRVKITEIYVNIVGNAVKYTPDYGTIAIRLEELPGDDDTLCRFKFTCKDNGIGISEEYLPYLFETFSREEDARVLKQPNSTGLGMSIVKKYIDLMDGTITVDTKKEEGTMFTIILQHRPVEEEVDEEKSQEVKDQLVDIADKFKGIRILLAEDIELNQEIEMEFLSMLGIDATLAVDGIDVVTKFENSSENDFDLILMDVQMPKKNGYEATQMIRSLDRRDAKEIPIIALTANAFDEDKKRAAEAGMNSHMSKPIDIKNLSKVIEIWV